MLKLKVISDGTSEGTKVFDIESGEVLPNVIDFEYKVGVDGNPQIVLTLVGVPVEVNYTAKVTNLEELDTQDLPYTTMIFREAT